MSARTTQRDLFGVPTEQRARAPRTVEAAESVASHAALAARLPSELRFGTTSWSFPGWAGLVYAKNETDKALATDGLPAYAKHPLFRAVEIDRTYYGPLPATTLRAFAEDVPADFRFVAKAHEDCTVARYPLHARYGKKRGEANPRYLDADYAIDKVVGPFQEGLGAKGGALLFQFPPHEVTDPARFADKLHAFLERLPKGVTYAVEVRNAELLTPGYVGALESTGAVHCHNIWSQMPAVLRQAKLVPPPARRPLVVRWLLRAGLTFEDARARYAPFGRLVEEDVTNRMLLTDLLTKAAAHGVPTLVIVDNKAEGCAPESIVRLARAIAERRRSSGE